MTATDDKKELTNKEKFLKPFNGSMYEAAKALDVGYSFIQKCLDGKKKWPIKRIEEANKKFGIPKYVLRPDLYADPTKAKK